MKQVEHQKKSHLNQLKKENEKAWFKMDEKRNKLAEMRALLSEKNQELEMFDSKIIKTKQ